MSKPKSSSATRYTLTARVLHAALALALLGLIVMGAYMTGLPFSPQRLKLYNWHKWAGMLVLAASLLRLIWRVGHPAPALPASIANAMPRWQHWAHHGTHHALYLLFFAVPLLGWAYSSAAGFTVALFGVMPLPDWVPADKALSEVLKPLHHLSAWALAGLAALHVAAALKHHWIDRDGLLARMSLRPARGI